MEGVSSEWAKIHPDVRVEMSVDRNDRSFNITMVDNSHVGRMVTRIMPFQTIPLEQGELVLEDWFCSVYEQMYHDMKNKRDSKEL